MAGKFFTSIFFYVQNNISHIKKTLGFQDICLTDSKNSLNFGGDRLESQAKDTAASVKGLRASKG